MDLGHLENKYYDNFYCKNYLSNGFWNLLSNLKAFILVKLNQDLDVLRSIIIVTFNRLFLSYLPKGKKCYAWVKVFRMILEFRI